MNKTAKTVLALGLSFAASVSAQNTPEEAASASVYPFGLPDGAYVKITGAAESLLDEGFNLSYNIRTADSSTVVEKEILVEMDDFLHDREVAGVQAGDVVVVEGRMDRDELERATIEASTVFVRRLGEHLFASNVDEEEYLGVEPITDAESAPVITVQGEVTSSDETGFVVDAGLLDYKVMVGMQNRANLNIEVGDRVSVKGEMDNDFVENQELEAHAIMRLSPAA